MYIYSFQLLFIFVVFRQQHYKLRPLTNPISSTMIFELLVSILQSTAFRIILVSAISTLLYEAVRAPRVYPGFSLVGVDLKDGYSRALSMAREQWSTHGKEILDQGLHQASVHTIEFCDCS